MAKRYSYSYVGLQYQASETPHTTASTSCCRQQSLLLHAVSDNAVAWTELLSLTRSPVNLADLVECRRDSLTMGQVYASAMSK